MTSAVGSMSVDRPRNRSVCCISEMSAAAAPMAWCYECTSTQNMHLATASLGRLKAARDVGVDDAIAAERVELRGRGAATKCHPVLDDRALQGVTPMQAVTRRMTASAGLL
jgi:hypothetical protein